MSGPGLLRRRTPVALAALVAASLVASVGAATSSAADPQDGTADSARTTDVQILSLNDFHGALEPPTGSAGRLGPSGTPEFGGAEYLATYVRDLRAANPNTIFASAGDLIGATPLTSALFHDEPTIEAFNAMGLDYNGVGNHEFDEGIDELLRMQRGGCHPVDGCQDGDEFTGADFEFLAANVKYKDTGDTIFPPYDVREYKGVKVGVVGMTLEGTPQIVTPSGISTVNFLDEADSVNALVPVLKEQGVETIVVLLHEGGSTSTAGNGAGAGADKINECANPTGALPGVVSRMSDEIDVVITGHTNWAVNCKLGHKIVTGAGSNGRIVTDIDLTLSRSTKEIVAAKVNNVPVARTAAKAADMTALIKKYKDLSAPLANEIVGSITTDITTSSNAAGESAAGDVIADAQLAATAPAAKGGAVVAFMNPGGIRNSGFFYAPSAGGEAPGEMTYGELFGVQPFSNVLTVVSCSGSQIDQILEQQWQPPRPDGSSIVNILQVSNGFTYSYNAANGLGSRVDASTIKVGGVTVDPAATYRVATNNFVVTGGDGFTAFTQCTNPLGGDIDLDALVAYFKVNSPVTSGPQNRITRLG